jgi:methionyl-tRNA synthetase
MTFGLDSSFSESALVQRINSDLANDLGNLFSRVLAMAHKYFDGVVPEVDPKVEAEFQLGLHAEAAKAVEEFDRTMHIFAFHKALMAIWEFIGHMNKYIDVTAPWELAKKKSSRKQLEALIYNLLEGLRIISGLIYPVIPDTAKTMQKHLGLDPAAHFYLLDKLRTWRKIPPGTRLLKSIALFPRIDVKNAEPAEQEPAEAETAIPDFKPQVTLEAFAELDLRVATVINAESIPRAKKLLKLEVDLGEKRTIVAGIAADYAPESLIGKQIIIVSNLKPAKIMGILSNGMLLAAVDGDRVTLATLDDKVKPGTPIS